MVEVWELFRRLLVSCRGYPLWVGLKGNYKETRAILRVQYPLLRQTNERDSKARNALNGVVGKSSHDQKKTLCT